MKRHPPNSGWTVKDLAWTLETKLVVTGRQTSKLHYHYHMVYYKLLREGPHAQEPFRLLAHLTVYTGRPLWK